VVVSSDREVRNSIEKFGATAVYAGEFSEILRQMDARGSAAEDLYSETPLSRMGNRLSKAEWRRQEKLKKLRFR
jgi:hypothetical protein